MGLFKNKKKSNKSDPENDRRKASNPRLATAISPKVHSHVPAPGRSSLNVERKQSLARKASKENVPAVVQPPKRQASLTTARATPPQQRVPKPTDDDILPKPDKDLSFAAIFEPQHLPPVAVKKPEPVVSSALSRKRSSVPTPPKIVETKPAKTSDRPVVPLKQKPAVIKVDEPKAKSDKVVKKASKESIPQSETATRRIGSKEHIGKESLSKEKITEKDTKEKASENVKHKKEKAKEEPVVVEAPRLIRKSAELLPEVSAREGYFDGEKEKLPILIQHQASPSTSSTNTNDENAKTVFEVISVESKPFVSPVPQRKLVDESRLDDDAPTVFEKIEGGIKPAHVPMEKAKHTEKSKEGIKTESCQPTTETGKKSDTDKKDDDQKSPSAGSPPEAKAVSVYMPVLPAYGT